MTRHSLPVGWTSVDGFFRYRARETDAFSSLEKTATGDT